MRTTIVEDVYSERCGEHCKYSSCVNSEDGGCAYDGQWKRTVNIVNTAAASTVKMVDVHTMDSGNVR